MANISKNPKSERQWQKTYDNKMRRIQRQIKKAEANGKVYKFTQPKLKP